MMRRSKLMVPIAMLGIALTLLPPISTAMAAAKQFNVAWHVENSWLGSPDLADNGCSGAGLARQYAPLSSEWLTVDHYPTSFFAVNGVKLSTTDHADLGGYDESRWGRTPDYHTGIIWWAENYDSRFSGTLLRAASDNKVDFDSYGNLFNTAPPDSPSLSNIQSEIYLEGDSIGRRLLLSEFKCGWFQRKTVNVAITLAEIDPQLASLLNQLIMALAAAKQQLLADATAAEGVPAQLARFDELAAALELLFSQGFDQITLGALDDLFTQFLDLLPDGFADQIAGLFEDLKTDVEELRAELEQEVQRLRDATASLDGTVLEGAAGNGFDASDPGSFLPPPGLPEVPDVELPDVPGGEWNPTHDPYLAYADDVLDRLQGTMDSIGVASRSAFLDIIAEWENNQALFEHALDAKAQLTPEEYLAFARQRQRVSEFIHTQMNEEGWFRDNPVPQEVRDLVDLLIGLGWYSQAHRLHRHLNEWRGELTPQQGAIVEMLAFIDAALRELKASKDKDAVSRLFAIVNAIIEMAKIGVQFTPLGDVLDVCEAITGWEGCNPNGRRLSITERAIAAAGIFIAGSTAAWRHVVQRLNGHEAKETLGLLAGALEKGREAAKRKVPKSNGTWDGVRGESRWKSSNPIVQAATNGEGIVFKNRYPQFQRWAYGEPLVVLGMDGCKSDFNKIYAVVAATYGLASNTAAKNWLTQQKLTPHHVEDGRSIILVPLAIHENVPHEGGASFLRALHGKKSGC